VNDFHPLVTGDGRKDPCPSSEAIINNHMVTACQRPASAPADGPQSRSGGPPIFIEQRGEISTTDDLLGQRTIFHAAIGDIPYEA
jgi:hypothetical protein